MSVQIEFSFDEEINKLFDTIALQESLKLLNPSPKTYCEKTNFISYENLVIFIQSLAPTFPISPKDVSLFLASCDAQSLVSFEGLVQIIRRVFLVSNIFDEIYEDNQLALGRDERLLFHLSFYSMMAFSIKGLSTVSEYALKTFNQIPFAREPELIFVDLARPKEIEAETAVEVTLKNLEMLPRFSTEVFQGNFMLAVTKITEAYLPLLLMRTPQEVLFRAPLVYRVSDLLMNNPMLPVLITKLRSSEIQLIEQIEILKMLACLYHSIKFKSLAASSISGLGISQFGIIYHMDAISSVKELALNSNCFPAKDLSLLCLAFILKYSPKSEAKGQLLNDEFIGLVCSLVSQVEQPSTIIRLSFLLRQLAKETCGIPDKRDIRIVLHGILWASAVTLQLSEANDVAKNVLHSAKYCFRHVGITEEFFPFFERILIMASEGYYPPFLRKLALMTLVSLVSFSADMARHCSEPALLNSLSDTLYDLSVESSVRKAILILANTLALKGHTQAILQCKLIYAMVKLLTETSILRSDVLFVFKTIISASSTTMIAGLLDLHLHKMLLGVISNNKYMDEELKSIGVPVSVYYDGFAIISSIQILAAIIQKGFTNASTPNCFLEKFSFDVISRLKESQESIFSSDMDILRSLTRPIVHNHCRIQFDVLLSDFYELLIKVHSSGVSVASKKCVDLLSTLSQNLKRYMTRLNSNAGSFNPEDFSNFTIKIKCLHIENFPQGDNRVFMIKGNTPLEELYKIVRMKYQMVYEDFYLLLEDERKERVTLDHEDVFRKQLSKFISESTSDEAEFRIIVHPKYVPVYGTGSPGKELGYDLELQCYNCGSIYASSNYKEDPLKPFLCPSCYLIPM